MSQDYEKDKLLNYFTRARSWQNRTNCCCGPPKWRFWCFLRARTVHLRYFHTLSFDWRCRRDLGFCGCPASATWQSCRTGASALTALQLMQEYTRGQKVGSRSTSVMDIIMRLTRSSHHVEKVRPLIPKTLQTSRLQDLLCSQPLFFATSQHIDVEWKQ